MHKSILTNLFVISAFLLTLVSCSGDSKSRARAILNPNSGSVNIYDGIIDVDKLNDTSSEYYFNEGRLDFDDKTSAAQNPEEEFEIINSGDSTVNFTMTVSGDEFVITDDECGGSIAGESSCKVKVQFTGGTRKNGEIDGTITFTATPEGLPPAPATDNMIVLQLRGKLSVPGNEQSAAIDGRTALTLAMVTPYQQGSDPVQTITVTNSGDEALSNLHFEITADYSIFADNCPSVLEAGENCTLRILYNEYEELDNESPKDGSLTAESDNTSDYKIDLRTGVVTEQPE